MARERDPSNRLDIDRLRCGRSGWPSVDHHSSGRCRDNSKGEQAVYAPAMTTPFAGSGYGSCLMPTQAWFSLRAIEESFIVWPWRSASFDHCGSIRLPTCEFQKIWPSDSRNYGRRSELMWRVQYKGPSSLIGRPRSKTRSIMAAARPGSCRTAPWPDRQSGRTSRRGLSRSLPHQD